MQKRYTHALLRSSLALFLLATSCCEQKENTSPPAKEEKEVKITRADTPGTMPVSGTLEYEKFTIFSTCYLLAACEGPSPFSGKYKDYNGALMSSRNFLPTFSQAFEAIIAYVRAGGGEEQKEDIQKQVKLLFTSSLRDGVVMGPNLKVSYSVPGSFHLHEGFFFLVKEYIALNYHVMFNTPQTSLQRHSLKPRRKR